MDIVLFFAILVVLFINVTPVLSRFIANQTITGVIVLLMVVLLVAAVQLPFILAHQTVGKAFFRLKIVSTNNERPMTASVVFQREVFCKIATGYLLCIPALYGRTGGHETATETEVVST